MDWRFLYNRYLFNRRIVDGYKFQFLPFSTGSYDEKYFADTILRRGETFVDIGANVGAWAIPAARFYDRVLAFEPAPKAAETLKKNLQMNRIMNVDVFPFALGDKIELDKTFWVYPEVDQGNLQGSFLPEYLGDRATTSRKVSVRTLDDVVLRSASVIKIDTEGYELPIIRGAVRTIMRWKPRLCIETHRSEDPATIKTLLAEYRWKTFKRLHQTIMLGAPEYDSK